MEMRKPDIDEIRRLLTELGTEWKEHQSGRQINLTAPDGRVHAWYPETGTLMFNWQFYGSKEVIRDVYSPELAVWIVRNVVKERKEDGYCLDK